MARKKKNGFLSTDDLFFESFRSWSRIKNEIIANYLHPYLIAVRSFSKSIVIVDSFAGEGRFDRDNVDGSPIIICKAIQLYAPNIGRAILVNRKEKTHKLLENNIKPFVDAGLAVRPIRADAQSLLKVFRETITDETVLIYMDPFGIKGCDFSIVESFLERGTKYSTEFIINLNMPIIHRYAPSPQWRELLNRILGGDYWDAIFNSGLYEDPEEKDYALIKEYENRLRKFLPFVGSCPVRERRDSQIKYFVTFCSRNSLSMTLMNDIMCDAYNNYMHNVDLNDMPLFQEITPHWKDQRRGIKHGELSKNIVSLLSQKKGMTRKSLWIEIVVNNFRKYRSSEYINTVKDLVEKKIIFHYSSTGRLNDSSKLFTREQSK